MGIWALREAAGLGHAVGPGRVTRTEQPVLTSTICHPPQNYPLYIRSVPTENELKFHYTVHTSLDVVDEKISAMGKALVDQRELYLGLLYPTEDYKVYLYNTKCIFITRSDLTPAWHTLPAATPSRHVLLFTKPCLHLMGKLSRCLVPL